MNSQSNDYFIDPEIEEFYENIQEKDRLKGLEYSLEYVRTFSILNKTLPSPPAHILDVGGAAGIYAFPLTQLGYQVHLIDPVALHITQAQEYTEKSKIQLAGYHKGDARHLPFPNESVDTVLFLGPLYHLIKAEDRLQALREALRVLKTGGIFIAAAISRFASFMDGVFKNYLSDEIYQTIVENDIKSGQHNGSKGKYFTTAYFHHPQEFKEEIQSVGFQNVILRAVEGPVWHEPSLDAMKKNPQVWQKFLSIIESIEKDETIVGASAHIVATAVKNKNSS